MLDAQLAQLFLEALPVQTNRGRGAGDVPAVLFELAVQVGDLKLALGLAEIGL